MSKTGQANVLFLSLGSALFAFLIYRVGPAAIYAHLNELGWRLPVAFLPYLLVYLLDTWGWKSTLDEKVSKLPFAQLFSIRMAGESINYLTPLSYLCGEPVKASLLKRHGIPLDQGLASVVLAKTVMTLAQLVFVLVGIALALRQAEDGLILDVAAGVAALGALILAFLLVAQQRGLFSGLLKLIRKLPVKLDRLDGMEEDFRSLDRNISNFYIQNRKGFALSFLFHLAGWLVGGFEVYLVLRFLGIPIGLSTALAIEALTTVAKAAAFFIPAGLGTQEGGNILIFLAFTLSPQAGMTFSLVRRARELIWAALGLLVLAHYELKAWAWLRINNALNISVQPEASSDQPQKTLNVER